MRLEALRRRGGHSCIIAALSDGGGWYVPLKVWAMITIMRSRSGAVFSGTVTAARALFPSIVFSSENFYSGRLHKRA